jgi:hypothetical protein
MIAFDHDALWSKSKVFIERGLKSRDQSDSGTFHMWAALALELLGKAALAKIHPALVADPTRFDSLLVACGQAVTDDTRSIAAKTTYERLTQISKAFDERARSFCMVMANRRNEELHSGSSPTTDLDPRAWVPEFWRIAIIVCEIAGRTIEQWLGQDEARRAREVSTDASRVAAAAVEARIERCRDEFVRRYPKESAVLKVVLETTAKALWPAESQDLVQASDSYQRIECPACAARGWLFGNEVGRHRHPFEYDEEHGTGWQMETIAYHTEGFACSACGLRIIGRVELDAAELAEEFEEEREVEPDYEPDYGND